ncbi:MAG: inositol-phosphate phosphatase [Candidatus Aenigmarchaeota archaeon]|nr:inositol-phosphate phosphatase [Candidatus Aenigmarchaeota archaeon]
MSQSPFLKTALKAAKAAEEVIMDYYSADEIRPSFKPDSTPVTEADREAERMIKETIKNAFPEHGFLGEESGSENAGSEYIWIIDPLDGTENFIRKIPVFSTQIALMRKGEVILGVSNGPAMKELMFAEKGKGTFLDGNRIHVSSTKEISKAMVCYSGLKFFGEKGLLNGMLRLIKDCYKDRGYGDFWMYHLLASGRAEITVEPYVKIWDIAALKVAIDEAGGIMTDIHGRPIGMETSTCLAANRKLHGRVLEYFRTS